MSIDFRRHTLPNGMEIIAEIDPDAHTSAIGFFVKTGARDEATAEMGVSHFLEHMMFKGTATRSATDVDREFDDLGAVHNAYTTNEMTAFYAQTLPEHLPAAETILSDIMRPSLRQTDFDEEKSVILEEIAMYIDHPFWVLYERAMETYYRVHPLSHRVLGTNESITNLTRDRMQAYFDHRYSADNTVVALAGRLDFDDMVARIGDHCGHWPRTNVQRNLGRVEVGADAFTIDSERVNRHYELIMAPGPAAQDERRYAAGILMQILGDSEGSRLYWALVETGLAEEAQAQFDGRDGCGDMLVFFACAPEDAAEVEAITLEEMRNVTSSLTDDDLVRVRSKVATGATLAGERPGGRMRRLGRLWTYHAEYRPLEDELARINAVTLDEVRAVAAAFPFDPLVIGRLRPKA